MEQLIKELKQTLRQGVNAVLTAAPGAGKTTRVPLALLNEPWLAGRRILMLEPRRLAVRTAARYMAAQLGEKAGETVGYRVRLDTKVSRLTRLEIVTEGILTRLLQQDPALGEFGLVIFDEFHERSLDADLGLALCLEAQSVLRPDLRLLVMSATLDVEPVAGLLGGAPVLSAAGRMYPVETRFVPPAAGQDLFQAVVRIILAALREDTGDILVFLPGVPEIRKVQAELSTAGLPGNIRILPLHGKMPLAAQDTALRPGLPDSRKVVLATNVAQTSLTVAGVRVVIDSGLERSVRFSPRTGMSRLTTMMVSAAAAEQRRGRAGRLGPGICYRLWSSKQDERLVLREVPEILEADLSALALELAIWGTDACDLRWLDPPPAAGLNQARELLRQLGALDETGKITARGREIAAAGLHPRLAHMILEARALGLGGLACELAAIVDGRNTGPAGTGSDLRERIMAARREQRDDAEVRLLRTRFGVHPDPVDVDACGKVLALAYPDRVGTRRRPGHFLLRNGRGAILPENDPLSGSPFLVAAELDDQGAASRIYLAAPLGRADIEELFSDQFEQEEMIAWDSAAKAVKARSRRRLGAIILSEQPLIDADAAAMTQALLDGIRREGLGMLPWTKNARQLQARVTFLARNDPAWPDVSDASLYDHLDEWLGPHLYGMKSAADLARLNLTAILLGLLAWPQRQRLDRLAPTHVVVPSGRSLSVDYRDPDHPALAVRLQEMFGLADTPRIMDGRYPLTLHLLSPAQRPVQVTQDLASFWKNAYFEVRKDLAGRYPKHDWPENPLEAAPSSRAKPR